MTTRKIPMRMCCGCGQMFPKRELVRIVRTPEGKVELDLTGKKSGRGAYICKCLDCLKLVRKNKRAARALECEIADSVYEEMLNELEQNA